MALVPHGRGLLAGGAVRGCRSPHLRLPGYQNWIWMAPAADDASSFPEAASASTRVRCAAVMIGNTGSAAARWWWNEPAGAATRILTSPAAPTASRGGGLARGYKAPEAGRQPGGAGIEAEREVVTVEDGQKNHFSLS